MTRQTPRIARALGALLLTLTLAASATAVAFDNQPNGFGDFAWGTTAASAVKGTPEFRKRYKVRQIQKALKSSDVELGKSGEFLGRDMDVKFTFGQKGLHKVTLDWEDTRAEAYAAYKEVFEDLKKLWGEPDKVGHDKELVWDGAVTHAEAKRKRVASGSGVTITLTAKSFDADAPAGAKDLGKKKKGGKEDKSILDNDPGVF